MWKPFKTESLLRMIENALGARMTSPPGPARRLLPSEAAGLQTIRRPEC